MSGKKEKKTNSLISNIPPPSELPSFILQNQPPPVEAPKAEKSPDTSENSPTKSNESEVKSEPIPSTSKSIPDPSPTESDLPSIQDISDALSPITEGVKNSVFYGWMKDTMKTVSKVSVEKAKASIDKVVTTLDPQMSALIYSGGETEVVVASISDDDDEVMSIREAFQKIFGRATVYGHNTIVSNVAAQPVGFESAELFAKERINHLRANETYTTDKVIVTVCDFLVEVYKNQWFDCCLLMLSDPSRNISLKSFTQMTSIPLEIIKKLENDTPKDYEKRSSGFAVRIGNYMGEKLDTLHYEWHKKYTSIDRYDMILSAGRSLASTYKLEIQAKLPSTE